MSAPVIRDAVAGDAAALAGLLAELGYPASAGDVAGRLARVEESTSDRVLVATLGGEVVGLVSLNVSALFAESGALGRITSLVVAASARGRGVGAVLLAAAEDAAAQAGCSLVQVSSGRRPEREAAHRFYPRHGYADSGAHHTLYEKPLPGTR